MLNRNVKFIKDFNLYLKKLRESYSTYGSTSYSRVKTIFFYEWSTMDNGAKHYESFDTFHEFCKESKIEITPSDLKTLENSYCIYCTCEPGNNKLMVGYTYYGLSNMLKDCESKHVSTIN